jgi:signal transduction histidine kinase
MAEAAARMGLARSATSSAVVRMTIPVYDSRQLLAASIERSLRIHMPAGASPTDLGAAIERKLLSEGRRNELTIAYLRGATAIAFTVLYLAAYLWPGAAGFETFAPTAALVAGVWSVAGLLLVVALRKGWYRPSMRHALPLADGLVVLVIFAAVTGGSRHPTDPVATVALVNLAALCVFLAFSGALRLTPSAAELTTVIALAIFLLAAARARLQPIHLALVATTLVVAGLLARTVTAIVRRVVMGEVGRLTLERLYVEAEQAIVAREEILSVVSHDLRNPLSTIAMTIKVIPVTTMPTESQ